MDPVMVGIPTCVIPLRARSGVASVLELRERLNTLVRCGASWYGGDDRE